MKKFLKGLGAVIIALMLVGGGYFAGQRVQVGSIISAMPKRSIERAEEEALPENLEPALTLPPNVEAPVMEQRAAEERAITKTDTSSVDETWSEVDSTKNTTSSEALTLYTSAEKDGDEFVWDDSQKWVLELSDGEGGYYTLYDQQITNGNVYYEVAENGSGDKIIYLYTITGAGMSIMQYTRTENGFAEKSVYNSGAVNRLFTSVPNY